MGQFGLWDEAAIGDCCFEDILVVLIVCDLPSKPNNSEVDCISGLNSSIYFPLYSDSSKVSSRPKQSNRLRRNIVSCAQFDIERRFLRLATSDILYLVWQKENPNPSKP